MSKRIGVVYIARRRNWYSDEIYKQRVWGLIDGGFAITPTPWDEPTLGRPTMWTVTHIATGARMGEWYCLSKEDALKGLEKCKAETYRDIPRRARGTV